MERLTAGWLASLQLTATDLVKGALGQEGATLIWMGSLILLWRITQTILYQFFEIVQRPEQSIFLHLKIKLIMRPVYNRFLYLPAILMVMARQI